MPEKIIGILGGVGPWATVELFRRILEGVSASRDQDYPEIIVYCNSKIPNRIQSIRGEGKDCTDSLQNTAKTLEASGVDFIIIASCGTHYYYEEVQRAVKIPVLNLIDETSHYIQAHHSKYNKIGLISAAFTIEEGVFHKYFGSEVSLISPDIDMQNKVVSAIDRVKVGRFESAQQSFIDVANHLISKGAEIIVYGCTEVSTALSMDDIDVIAVDPFQIIATKALRIITNS